MKTFSNYFWQIEKRIIGRYYRCSKCKFRDDENYCKMMRTHVKNTQHCVHWERKI